MSANNWTICPRCHARAEEAQAAKKREAEEAYGKVSQADYLHLLKQAERSPERLPSSLREDYHIGICTYPDDSRTFEVEYRCECQSCGFTLSFKHSEPVRFGE